MSYIIEIKDINKSFNGKQVLNNLSLNISDNTILGIIGENGAGKTTLFKSILGLAVLDDGKIMINGLNIREGERAFRDIGFLLEPRYYSHLSTYNNLKEQLILSGKYNVSSKQEINSMLNFLNLNEVINKKINRFSFGMKQRVGLAQALITKPKILFLDEPLVGLDPDGTTLFKKKIQDLHQNQNCTIVLSGHQLEDIQEMCDEVAILRDGRILIHDKTKNLVDTITVFTFDKCIHSIKPETYSCCKKAIISEDNKTLYLSELPASHFRFISELYADYTLLNVSYSKNGLEKYFGKDKANEYLES